ncbi:serine hydrolase [Levilactobacillus zymae]|uniref:serine hydrolase n=1 Tax=Levilactobacillus zymae TaxID=267363 RepID=UPI0028B75193|nr:serine hydrolase [Levilactobacillus zymae]MDT6979899.1 serine hydrolase [Levilactobacillus zymae]
MFLKPVKLPPHFWVNHRHLILTSGLVILLGVGGLWGFQNRQALSAKKAAPQTPATATQIAHTQTQVQRRLQHYITQQAHNGTTSISFYNLGAKAGTPAAKQPNLRRLYAAGKLSAGINAHTPEVAASTYKLFIAAYVFQQHHQLGTAWTDGDTAGFEDMIINSGNDYADHTLDTNGLLAVDNFIGAQKWYTPVFNAGQTANTTAHSLNLALQALDRQDYPYNHAADRQWLLKLMRRQVYRSGIPAGAKAATPGTTVADKVGWYADTNNDAGIVTLPNGERYVLVIMTHGQHQSGFSGFPRIAKITQHIQHLVYGPQVARSLTN